MAISLKHSFTSPKADGVDSTLVQPSNWNAEHTLTLAAGRLLGNGAASAGAAQEITPSANLSLTSGALDLASSFSISGTATASIGAFTTANITTLNVSGDVNFNGTGAAKMPTGTTAQRPTGAAGDFRFNSTTGSFEGYNGTNWGSVGGGATGAGGDQVFYLNSQVVTTTYSIPSGQNAMATGPITINSGAVVTIPSGSRWVVL